MALELSDVGIDYGGGEVVRGVSLTVEAGEIVAVLGPNGAGKTSLLRAAAGLAPISRGTIVHAKTDVSAWSAERRARHGIALVPEDRGLIPDMTVFDHLWLGYHSRPNDEALKKVYEMFPRLAERRRTTAGNLSGGEAQMLAIATALLLRPRTLLIDELSFGLAPAIVIDLLKECRSLAEAQGIGIIIVEQFVDLALRYSDRAVVMVHGDIRMQGTSQDLANRKDEVEQAYLHHVNETPELD